IGPAADAGDADDHRGCIEDVAIGGGEGEDGRSDLLGLVRHEQPPHRGWYNPHVERYLENRVAIVTGGAGGIGSELVKGMVAAGAAVVVNDYGVTIDGRDPSPDAATALVEAIEAGGGRATAHTGSVADHEVAR